MSAEPLSSPAVAGPAIDLPFTALSPSPVPRARDCQGLRINQQKLCCALSVSTFWACLRFRSAGLTACRPSVTKHRLLNNRFSCRPPSRRSGKVLLRKEVIQPQVPLRLPCYDFIPVTAHTLGPCLLAVGTDTSGTSDSHDVTGGVYKARERIHDAVADASLLAIPASCRRVAAYNPNWAQF